MSIALKARNSKARGGETAEAGSKTPGLIGLWLSPAKGDANCVALFYFSFNLGLTPQAVLFRAFSAGIIELSDRDSIVRSYQTGARTTAALYVGYGAWLPRAIMAMMRLGLEKEE